MDPQRRLLLHARACAVSEGALVYPLFQLTAGHFHLYPENIFTPLAQEQNPISALAISWSGLYLQANVTGFLN